MRGQKVKGKIGLLATSSVMMSYMAVSAILSAVSKSFPEASVTLIQMITTGSCIVTTIVSVLMQKITPYVSKKRLIIAASVIHVFVGMSIYFFHPTVVSMVVMSALLGIVSGVCIPCVPGLIHDTYDEKEGGILLGLQGGFISGGAMLFIWLGGQLGKNDWKNCYLVYLLTIPIIIIEILTLPEGKLAPKKQKTEKRDKIPMSVWIFTMTQVLFNMFIYVYASNISMLVDFRKIGGTLEASYASALYNLAGMAAGCLVGYIIPKLRQQIFSLAVALGIAGMFLCFLSRGFVGICLGSALCGMSFTIFVPAANYYASMDSTDYNRMICLAIINTGSSAGHFISPVFTGALGLSVVNSFWGAGVGMSALLVITLISGFCFMRKRQ